MTAIHPIRVAIVHLDSLVRSCLATALARAQDIDVTTVVPDVRALDSEQPAEWDVIVADYGAGVEIAGRSTRSRSMPPVLVVSGADREWEVRNALARQVRGYLVPGFELAHVDDGVRAVRRGGRYLCARAAARLAESLAYEALTERETEVLSLVAQGEPNKTISRRLNISIGTVKSHIKATYGKLGVMSRSQAIALAERRGMLRRADDPASVPAGTVARSQTSSIAGPALGATTSSAFGMTMHA